MILSVHCSHLTKRAARQKGDILLAQYGIPSTIYCTQLELVYNMLQSLPSSEIHNIMLCSEIPPMVNDITAQDINHIFCIQEINHISFPQDISDIVWLIL